MPGNLFNTPSITWSDLLPGNSSVNIGSASQPFNADYINTENVNNINVSGNILPTGANNSIGSITKPFVGITGTNVSGQYINVKNGSYYNTIVSAALTGNRTITLAPNNGTLYPDSGNNAITLASAYTFNPTSGVGPVAPNFGLTSGSNTARFTPASLTTGRTYTTPDATGTMVVQTSTQSTFTINWSGFSTAQSSTARVDMQNDEVMIQIPQLLATFGASAAAISATGAVPAAYRPTINGYGVGCSCLVWNNQAELGSITINSGGDIEVSNGPANANFTATGLTCGWNQDITISYMIRTA